MSGENATVSYYPPSGYFIGLICFAILCIIVGVIGNIGVIAYNIFMNHSKTPTTYFIVNLAISDIVVCVTFFPPWLIKMFSVLMDTQTQEDHILICKIGMTSSFASTALSIVNLLAITVDRFVFISKPLKYSSIMTWKKTYILLLVIWLSAIVNTNFIFFNTEEVIGRSVKCQVKRLALNIYSFSSLIVPVICVFYFNCSIYKVAKNQRRKIRHQSCAVSYDNQNTTRTFENTEIKNRLKQLKIVKTFVIVLGVLLCCTIPSVIASTINRNICKRLCVPSGVSWLLAILVGANSAINPFIYSSSNKEYRIAYRQMFSTICRNN